MAPKLSRTSTPEPQCSMSASNSRARGFLPFSETDPILCLTSASMIKPLLLSPELVADAADRQQIERIGRDRFDLFPQPADMHVHGPLQNVGVGAPHAVQQRLPGEGL